MLFYFAELYQSTHMPEVALSASGGNYDASNLIYDQEWLFSLDMGCILAK
jgi:hypothetical protein